MCQLAILDYEESLWPGIELIFEISPVAINKYGKFAIPLVDKFRLGDLDALLDVGVTFNGYCCSERPYIVWMCFRYVNYGEHCHAGILCGVLMNARQVTSERGSGYRPTDENQELVRLLDGVSNVTKVKAGIESEKISNAHGETKKKKKTLEIGKFKCEKPIAYSWRLIGLPSNFKSSH